jgi:RNA polymerase-binding transcription factor
MTCHVARRIGEWERRLRRDRAAVSGALATRDAELGEYTYEHPGDVLDDATTNTTCRLLATLEARDRRVLDEIHAAEERLCAGRYGVCETCGRRIAVERLRAVGFARRCVGCEEAAERFEAAAR